MGEHQKATGADEFLAGVIEGFYGPPWNQSERSQVLDWMTRWGLNTYLYGPKDDPHHRAIWRQAYPATALESLGELIHACRQRGIRFIYALGPGLDVRYADPVDFASLQARFKQLIEVGCHDFCLLFDDIPDRMDPADLAEWGTLAAAQCGLTNALHAWLAPRVPHGRFFFCPTPYCGRMARAGLGGDGYLATVGRQLDPAIDVFWTGPEIISGEITEEHIGSLTALLRRRPTIWDNLHANDYDGRRFFAGPYAGRPLGLRNLVRGVLSNPNCEFPLNFVPLRTLAAWVHAVEAWDPRAAYLSAVQEWLPHWDTLHGSLTEAALVRLLDCYYLPYAEGTEAEACFRSIQDLLERDPATWGESVGPVRAQLTGLRDFCVRLTELRDRPLFYALSRRIWELREELDLLDRHLAFRANPANQGLPFRPDSHLPGTYRGGWVVRLQGLQRQQPDGAVELVSPEELPS
jgi:protein O-GlcNAcase/histone acetyltransferase